jgi:hypothetical protein
MKSIGFFPLLGCVLQISFEAQAASGPSAPNTNDLAARVAPTIIARTPSTRIWARIINKTNGAGEVFVVTNRAYTEMASGICFTNAAGQLVDAKEEVDIDNVAGGATATNAAHRVHFAGNANTAGGAIHLVAADGKVFDSRVYGLSYWDSASGKSVLLAPLQDCGGTLVGTNRVVYTNAFKGLKADIEYLFTKAGLEQDIILREQPPTPDSLGLNPQSTRLQVLSEFFSPPAPEKRSRVVQGIEEDILLNFGKMAIGMGKAFSIAGQGGTNAVKLGRVSKHWTRLEGRDFLIEEVPYRAISNAVEKLPFHASAAPVGTVIEHLAALEPLLPKEVASTAAPQAIQLAQSMPGEAGVVLDYTIFDDQEDMTDDFEFLSGSTYYISGALYFEGAPTLDGGSVLKFGSYAEIYNYCSYSLFNFNGSPGNPVMLTSRDNDSVGDIIDGSSGSPSPQCPPYTDFIFENGGGGGASGVTIANIRASYAGAVYEDDYDSSHIFINCEFVQCGGAAMSVGDDTDLYLQNVLLTGFNCYSGYYLGGVLEGNNLTLHAQNITGDSLLNFVDFNWNNIVGTITDSILCNCDNNIAPNFTLDHTAETSSVPWETSFLGDHYLPTNSPYLGAGSTTADQVGLYWYTTQTNQVPQGTSQVDLGYHYRATDSNGNPIDDDGDGGNWSAPSITTQPASQTALLEASVTFSVTANGTTPLSYQWRLNGNNISGATSSSLTIPSVQTTDAGTYSVLVGNPFSSAISSGATLALSPTPSITSQPTSQSRFLGTTASFSVVASGTGTLSYQWRFNGTSIPGATASTYSITSFQTTDAGTYSVVITNAFGSATSDDAILSITPPPSITSQPASQSVDLGSTASFSVSATGAGTLTYQWSHNGTSILGATASTYSITSVPASDAGSYVVAVGNAAGRTTSANAILTVNIPAQPPCGTGPWQLGYWSFSTAMLLDYWAGESNALDRLGIYTNNGTITGNVTYTNGVLGSGFHFDGNSSYISFGTNAGNFGTNDFTVDFWMQTTASGQQQGILDKRPVCGAAPMWDLRLDGDGTLSVEIDGTTGYYVGFGSQRHVNDGSFHHITLTRRGANICLYIDNALDTSIWTSGIANIENSTSLTAGSSACIGCDGTAYFVGVLDEIQLWQGEDNPWYSSRNWPPLTYYNVQNPATRWTNGLLVDSTNAAKMAYNYVEVDGSFNLNGGEGAVRFWFKPDWNGGTGTGTNGYLFELGDVTAPGGGWALEADSFGTGLSFVSGSNGLLTTYLIAPIEGWVSNSWHQVVLSYSGNATSLFLDGALAASGPGLAFEPDLEARLADGFTIGSDHNGAYQARGVFDELATFNCPMTQAEVTTNYPYPAILAQPHSQTVDSGSAVSFSVTAAGSGTLTYQWSLNGSIIAGANSRTYSILSTQTTDAGIYSVVVANAAGSATSANAVLVVRDLGESAPPTPIEWFPFPPDFETVYGNVPIAFTTNLISTPVDVPPYYGNALILDTTNLTPAFLNYNVQETTPSSHRNISYGNGTVVFDFAPNWASVSQGGTGPGEKAYFVGGGDWSANSPNGLFAIYADAAGANLYFGGMRSGDAAIYASAPISWSSNTWHQIGVEYTSGDCEIYLDGALADTGNGVTYVPTTSTWTNGFFIGSDNAGYEQARGAFWGMFTWSEEYGGGYADGWLDMSNAIAAWQGTLGGGFGGMMATGGGGFGMAMGMGGGFGRTMDTGVGRGDIASTTYTTNYADYTNFWITIGTSSSGTQAVVTIQNTQSNLTYNIVTNSVFDTNLADWGVWQTLTATNSVTMAPPVNIGTNTLFFASRLVLITGTNQIADWWQMLYFGQLGMNPNASFDGQGHTLLYDYQSNICPNAITFTIQLTNGYVNSANANLQLNITGGAPGCYAMFVTQTTSTNWLPLASTNLTVNLGSTDGVYTVCVGLSGSPSDPQQTWQSATLIKDTVPAKLSLTNMGSFSGSRPFIDPAGYSTKALSSLTFSVTNSAGAVSQDQGSVVDQQLNAADMCHTTNWFVCLDVALTPGTNYIGIQALDWAGNVTATNFAYDFDTNLATTVPAISLIWPQNGMQLSGTCFTMRGTLDDDTATVSGQYTDTNGVPQTIPGLVERGGQFWLENVPLNPGNNAIAVTATDAAGLAATTNLTLTQVGLTLTMDAVDSNQLNQVYLNVTGTISDSTYAVWVNGVQGSISGGSNWSATNVPVTAGGTGSFDVTAYPPGSAPSGNSWTNWASQQSAYPNSISSNAVQANVSWDKPPVVYVAKKTFTLAAQETQAGPNVIALTNTLNWTRFVGGYSSSFTTNTNSATGASEMSFSLDNWLADAGCLPVVSGLSTYSFDGITEYTNQVVASPFVGFIDSASASGVDTADSPPSDIVPITWSANGAQVVELSTGGKPLRQNKNLFVLNQTMGYLQYTTVAKYAWLYGGMITNDIAPEIITMGTYGNLGPDGNLWLALNDGQNLIITPTAPSPWYGGPLPSQQKYEFMHQCVATNPPDQSRLTLGVGEQVNFFFSPALPTNVTWNGGNVGSFDPTTGSNSIFTATNASGAGGQATATFSRTGDTVRITRILTNTPPTDILFLTNTGTPFQKSGPPPPPPTNTAGAQTGFYVRVYPTNVPFSFLNFKELPGPPTNVTGCFTNTNIYTTDPTNNPNLIDLNHKPTTNWVVVLDNNIYNDSVWSPTIPAPYSAGSFQWVIPNQWKMAGKIEPTSNFVFTTQRFTVDVNGTVTITKFGNHGVRRQTNGMVTNW